MLFKKQIRNIDFMNVLRREAVQQPHLDLKTLVKKVVDGPAPAYYVEYVTAMKRVREIRAGQRQISNSIRGRMWAEICGKVEELMQRRPNLPLSAAVARVLIDESASSFFLSYNRAMSIFMDCIGFYLPGSPRHETSQQKLERLVQLTTTALKEKL